MLPKARKKDLIIQEDDDETLVYDLKRDKAHCLNRSAALVWSYCDGRTTVATMSKKLSAKTKEPVREEVIWNALDRLGKVNLLDRKIDASNRPAYSRREMIRIVGRAAAVSLPIITSITAPTAAEAASCVNTSQCATKQARYSNRCCCSPKQSRCNTSSGTCKTGGASCTGVV